MIKIEYKQIIEELHDKLQNNKLKYKNTVIMGDNSTGKTFLLELLSVSENTILTKCDKSKKKLCNMYFKQNNILIDNIETVLSFNEILNINSFLENRFKNKKLIIVTHNLELISKLKNFNIINICKHCYGIYDSNDFNTFHDVRNIVDAEKNTNDIVLSTLLNLKLCNLWTSTEQSRLSEIEKMNLTMAQSKLFEQIRSL